VKIIGEDYQLIYSSPKKWASLYARRTLEKFGIPGRYRTRTCDPYHVKGQEENKNTPETPANTSLPEGNEKDQPKKSNE
jgi:hypothetical protein